MKFFSQYRNRQQKRNTTGGFLLVELIVALFLFSLVMTISVGSIIQLLDANRKTQSLKSVMNNLNLALDSMTKAIAVGRDYDCGVIADGVTDCEIPGDNQINFESNEDLSGDGILDTITYSFRVDAEGKGYLARAMDGGTPIRMTAPEIDITNLTFVVTGTAPFDSGDRQQPKVWISIQGMTREDPRGTGSTFRVQTAISQRIPDNL